MITPEDIQDFKDDVTTNVDDKTERGSIKRIKIGGFYRTIADWIAQLSSDTIGILPLTYSDLEADHKTYINPDLAGKAYIIFQNGINRFLNPDEYIIDVDGGFELIQELSDGDTLFVMGNSFGFTMNGNVSEVYNALDRVTPGAVLDARQGKVLYDLIEEKADIDTIIQSLWVYPVDFTNGGKDYVNTDINGTAGIDYNLIRLSDGKPLFTPADYIAIPDGFRLTVPVVTGIGIEGTIGLGGVNLELSGVNKFANGTITSNVLIDSLGRRVAGTGWKIIEINIPTDATHLWVESILIRPGSGGYYRFIDSMNDLIGYNQFFNGFDVTIPPNAVKVQIDIKASTDTDNVYVKGYIGFVPQFIKKISGYTVNDPTVNNTNPFNQSLNITDSPQFIGLTINALTILGTLPSTGAGLPSGRLWRDIDGTLKLT